ncbi:protein kinase family protein [Winogradskyella sediminis]|uniref:protein kinase family protein n=1 Tax=Winogradskyella sediminis TaxID=1382466 RepID=UPI003AA84408
MKFDGSNIVLNGSDPYENYIYLDGEGEFELLELEPGKKNKGASSNIFILKDPSDEVIDQVIKICKTPLSHTKPKSKKKIKRFRREIKAFELVQRKRINGVIEYFGSGETEIDGHRFLYIILEKADYDLAKFLSKNNFDFTNGQRVNFCSNIVQNFEQLHKIGIYHRDIKHDNIFCVSGEFKIGDLGLVEFRDKDFSIDYNDEKIGPIGWLSPEATNKMLSNNSCNHSYDCKIDAKSDIFQLGKLFWYIFQGNLPIGNLTITDSRFEDEEVYNILFSMLQHCKENRPSLENIETNLKPIKTRMIV